ncbi:hypothetical protein [Sphaerisporangium dianthi]|uniref:LytR/CpsA/Psr regulator C-terminal domain-containing protein n=1 Tax=Sphaerisporangium dianthi TaxID=1436120 RepID=A0ABV9CFK5_9ACTN
MRHRRLRDIAAITAGLLLLSAVTAGCTGTVRVDDRVRDELAAGGRLVAFAEDKTNASDPIFEYEYLVLDAGPDVGGAVGHVVSHLKSKGWSEQSADDETVTMESSRWQTMAYVEHFAAFLKSWKGKGGIEPEERVADKLGSEVRSPDSLVIVKLRHFG